MTQRDNEHKVFVHELAQQLGPGPIALQWSAEKRSLFFLLIHLSWMTLVMTLARSFTWPAAGWTQLFFELLILFTLTAGFIYLCFLSLVPGALGKAFFKGLMFFGACVGFFWMTQVFIDIPRPASQMRSFCEFKLILLSLVPLAHFFYLVKRGGFDTPSKTALSAGLAAGLVPAFVMHLACSRESLHVLVFHLLPVLAPVGISFLIYRLLR